MLDRALNMPLQELIVADNLDANIVMHFPFTLRQKKVN